MEGTPQQQVLGLLYTHMDHGRCVDDQSARRDHFVEAA